MPVAQYYAAEPNKAAANIPKVVAVVPIHNGREATIDFLTSLQTVTYPNLKVVVVDDGSTDDSAKAIAEGFPEVTMIRGDGSLWWSGATNAGIKYALTMGADYVLTINNDNVVEPDFIEPLVATACNTPRSMVTSTMYDHDDRSFIFSFGGIINWSLGEIRDRNNRRDKLDLSQATDCDWLHGSSTLIPVSAFREIGLFDQESCPQYQGDAEFSLRAKQHGYRLLVEPKSLVYNRTAVSSGTSILNSGTLADMLNNCRSPFYLPANVKLYRHYCPYRPVIFFLAIRYLRLLYSLLRRRFIDRTRKPRQQQEEP